MSGTGTTNCQVHDTQPKFEYFLREKFVHNMWHATKKQSAERQALRFSTAYPTVTSLVEQGQLTSRTVVGHK